MIVAFKKTFIVMVLLITSQIIWGRYEIVVDSINKIHPLILKGISFEFLSPAGSYQTLFESQSSGFVNCLIYKVPLGEGAKNGRLFFLKGKKKCSIGTKDLAEETIFEKVDSLKVFDIDWDKKFSFKVKARSKDKGKDKGKDKDKDIEIEFFLPFPSQEKGFWRGIRPARQEVLNEEHSLKEGQVCFQGCKGEENHCAQCPKGQWTPFISMKCTSQISAICGQYQCGQRGQRACARMTAFQKDISCEDIKKFVYCSYGREVECQGNGDLICR